MARRDRDPLEIVSLRQLRYFNAAMQSSSFVEAARTCSISQPALSEQIALLEDALGTRLFERVGRRASPTQAALQLHLRMTACMGDLQAALRATGESSVDLSGRVRIGLVQSYGACWVAPAVHSLQVQWPDLAVSLIRRTASALIDGVARGDFDFVVTFDVQDREDLEIERCFKEPYVAICPAPSRRPIRLKKLAGERLALLPTEYAMRRQIEQLFAAQGLRPNVHFESDSLEDLIDAVRTTGLTAVVNAATALSLQVSGATRIDEPTLVRTSCLVRARNRYHTRAALRLWDSLADMASEMQTKMRPFSSRS
ncbi:LysR family transcriptional regulator [Hydrogenophaga luteola]|uniref:LysR family transcriptional regulator n=1 Tax=Hydrogenophaga luteola TaxID=1591122 RepID=A0ABV7VZE1_9BURK